jgi:serine/threonine protein kinase
MVQDVKTNKYYALKKMSRSLMKKKKEIQPNSEGKICYVTALDKVMMEIKIMKKLQDPNFICLHAVIDDIEVDAIYLILEYAPRGAIMEWETKSHRYVSRHHALSSSGGLPENVARAAWANLVRGLQLLHSRRVIHRDIKPDNLLQFADGSCKLSDFGVAKMFEEEDQNFPFVSNSQGTFHFFPPESLKDGHCSLMILV